jgi:ppGpp synthetase/RelA/SpoT-type nucleotidyltranferase
MITYYQVTRPVNRLVQAVKKMEQGYWGPIDIGEGAWEIRWLTWRFGNMVQEVQNTMKHLLEAERKARSITFDRTDTVLPDSSSLNPCDSISKDSNPADSPEYQKLLVVCEQLESGTPDDAKAKQLGHSVWEQEVLEANRLGFHQLKARMENAALHLIDPVAYTALDERLNTYKASWRPWAEQLRDTMQRNLEKAGIPCAGILHRVKHTAGVWAKMQDKNLDVDEVYDLFAFRIIVPTEADCYAVLDIIHQTYLPEVSRFKDYIATPKDNGYRSLHTCVKAEEGPIFEVQIRSIAMDRQAEQGGAAHWVYKEDGRESDDKSIKQHWWYKILNKF